MATHVITKVFAGEFYRLNAGFFLLVIGFAFGFMSGIEHLALAQFFISSPTLMLVPALLWLLYAIKVISFNRQAIRKPENEFCLNLYLFSPRIKVIALTTVAFVELAPATMYGCFLMAMAFRYRLPVSSVMAAGILLLFHVLTALMLYRDVKNPHASVAVWWFKRWLDSRWSKSYYQIAIEWLARQEPLVLIGTKVAGYALLFGTLQIYKREAYDLRLMGIGVTMSFLANVVLLYHYHRFENFHFSLCRNLPLSFARRGLYFALTWLIICLPETGVLLTQFPHRFSIPSMMSCWLYGMSLLALLYGLLFLKDYTLESMTQRTFFLAILYFLLVLFQIPLTVLLAGNLVVGFTLWRRHYYSFEYLAEP